MPTIKEIRTEWKTIKSALGNLICYIDGKIEQLGESEQSWQRGYKNGLNFGWEKAWAIHNTCTVEEMEDLFELEYEAIADLDPEYAIQKLKEHDEKKQNEIRFGDEVTAWDTNGWAKFIAVGDEGDGWIYGFDPGGGSYRYPVESCRKTGKRWKVTEDGEQ